MARNKFDYGTIDAATVGALRTYFESLTKADAAAEAVAKQAKEAAKTAKEADAKKAEAQALRADAVKREDTTAALLALREKQMEQEAEKANAAQADAEQAAKAKADAVEALNAAEKAQAKAQANAKKAAETQDAAKQAKADAAAEKARGEFNAAQAAVKEAAKKADAAEQAAKAAAADWAQAVALVTQARAAVDAVKADIAKAAADMARAEQDAAQAVSDAELLRHMREVARLVYPMPRCTDIDAKDAAAVVKEEDDDTAAYRAAQMVGRVLNRPTAEYETKDAAQASKLLWIGRHAAEIVRAGAAGSRKTRLDSNYAKSRRDLTGAIAAREIYGVLWAGLAKVGKLSPMSKDERDALAATLAEKAAKRQAEQEAAKAQAEQDAAK